MGDPLYVNTEGVLGMARVHDAVAAGLGQLQNGGGLGESVGPAGPATTHGLIAHGMNSALSGVMARRDNILQSTGAAGQQLSEQLHRAAEAYRAGDEQGARGLSSAAEGIPGGGGGSGVSAGTPGGLGAAVPGSPAAGGGDVAQTLGQVGQQAGQIAQGVAQTLGQIPGQIAQGLTGVLSGIASGLGGIEGVGAGHAAGSGLGGLSDSSVADSVGEHDKSDADDRDRERRDPERHEKGEDDDKRILSVEHRGQAGDADAGIADPAAGPSGAAAPAPRRPAQTRPQDS
ncbi:type VII secretion target [Mycolicibacterium sp. lyk4-40-TYG-92]|uniref:type VII secretion target n=1 Tax=Mycolicibacterium sp. lyk4-40-TYG-92 TaxID=3040295 RepID=UPI00255064F6|nr:type VII secretion target [Mycolicibacterium sp. lyk4-40-TYG-92]